MYIHIYRKGGHLSLINTNYQLIYPINPSWALPDMLQQFSEFKPLPDSKSGHFSFSF